MASRPITIAIVAALTLAGAGGGSAGAQTPVRDAIPFSRQPIASLTLSATQRRAAFEGGTIALQIFHVSLPHDNESVWFHRRAASSAHIGAGEIPNGVYSVVFSIIKVDNAGTISIRGMTGMLATCTLQAQPDPRNPPQRCEATGIEVTNGKFSATLHFATGDTADNVYLSQITLNRNR